MEALVPLRLAQASWGQAHKLLKQQPVEGNGLGLERGSRGLWSMFSDVARGRGRVLWVLCCVSRDGQAFSTGL